MTNWDSQFGNTGVVKKYPVALTSHCPGKDRTILADLAMLVIGPRVPMAAIAAEIGPICCSRYKSMPGSAPGRWGMAN